MCSWKARNFPGEDSTGRTRWTFVWTDRHTAWGPGADWTLGSPVFRVHSRTFSLRLGIKQETTARVGDSSSHSPRFLGAQRNVGFVPHQRVFRVLRSRAKTWPEQLPLFRDSARPHVPGWFGEGHDRRGAVDGALSRQPLLLSRRRLSPFEKISEILNAELTIVQPTPSSHRVRGWRRNLGCARLRHRARACLRSTAALLCLLLGVQLGHTLAPDLWERLAS